MDNIFNTRVKPIKITTVENGSLEHQFIEAIYKNYHVTELEAHMILNLVGLYLEELSKVDK